MPVQPDASYAIAGREFIDSVNAGLKLDSPRVYEFDPINITIFDDINRIRRWREGFELDVEDGVIIQYLNKGWRMIASEIRTGVVDDEPFYNIVNRVPIRVSIWDADPGVVYPMALTGSTEKPGIKEIEVRLVVLSNYRVALPEIFVRMKTAYINYGGSKKFASAYEARLSQPELKEDVEITVDRGASAY